jgi:hypothetical protein
MYVLISDSMVINGPKAWSPKSFQNTLRNELNIEVSLPQSKTDNLPIFITETVKILPASLDYSVEHNPKIHYLHGPFWDFTNDFAVGSFTPQDYSVEFVKGSLKSKIASTRYDREVAGFTTTIQNTQIKVDTSRDGRNIFIQKYLIMSENETVDSKFPEGWFTLTKSELGTIVTGITNHIEFHFNWEASTSLQIDAATSLAELDSIPIE